MNADVPSVTSPRIDRVFDFSGGRLCLDFANTGRRPRGVLEWDDLSDYQDLVAWSQQTGILSANDARALVTGAADQPGRAGSVVGGARDLREAIYRVFSAVAAGQTPAATEVSVLSDAATSAWTHHRIAPSDAGFAWELVLDPGSLELPLWPVARSAAELITSADLTSVRECALETCSWLFLDRSKNHSRRWCDMKSCGNRSKARRHYRRRHAHGPAGRDGGA